MLPTESPFCLKRICNSVTAREKGCRGQGTWAGASLHPACTSLFTTPPSHALGPEWTSGVGVGLVPEEIRWSKVVARDRHLKWHCGRHARFWVQNYKHSQRTQRRTSLAQKSGLHQQDSGDVGQLSALWPCCCKADHYSFMYLPRCDAAFRRRRWEVGLVSPGGKSPLYKVTSLPFLLCVCLDWSEMVKYFSVFCFL